MNHLLTSRRTFISALGIVCLTAVGLYNSIDVSLAIAGICAGVAGANAFGRAKVEADVE